MHCPCSALFAVIIKRGQNRTLLITTHLVNREGKVKRVPVAEELRHGVEVPLLHVEGHLANLIL